MPDAAAPDTRDNIDHALSSYAALVIECSSSARSASRDGLAQWSLAGVALAEAREILKGDKGAYGRWCDAAGFPFSRAWRARLVTLAENFTAVDEAVKALPEDRQVWSVNGALAAWKAATRVSQPVVKAPKISKRELVAQLETAHARIADLEAQLARKGRANRSLHIVPAIDAA